MVNDMEVYNYFLIIFFININSMILYTLIVFKILILRFTSKWKGRFQGVCEKEMVKGGDVKRVFEK